MKKTTLTFKRVISILLAIAMALSLVPITAQTDAQGDECCDCCIHGSCGDCIECIERCSDCGDCGCCYPLCDDCGGCAGYSCCGCACANDCGETEDLCPNCGYCQQCNIDGEHTDEFCVDCGMCGDCENICSAHTMCEACCTEDCYDSGALPRVTYIDENGATKSTTDYQFVTDSTEILTDGFWVVSGNITHTTSLIVVDGETAHIILEDGSHLNVTGSMDNAGIRTTGATLHIYGQSGGTGMLTASVNSAYSLGAGIGGGMMGDGGTIIINGGNITATSGEGGAGIGGGSFGNGGTITINGGNITATAGHNDASAIGRGAGGTDETVTINGVFNWWTNTDNADPGDNPTASCVSLWSSDFSYIRIAPTTCPKLPHKCGDCDRKEDCGTHACEDCFPLVAISGNRISAGRHHVLAIDMKGGIWAWGNNERGQLGDNTTVSKSVPVRIKEDTSFVSVSAGSHFSLAIDADGGLWAWGWNNGGRLGDNSTTPRPSPVRIKADTSFIKISAGDGHSLAIDEDGGLWAWGWNDCGQLGDNTTGNKNAPKRIAENTRFISVAAGNSHSLAIDEDGGLWAWGRNNRSQLGNDSVDDSLLPVKVGGETLFASVSAGLGHSLAIDKDGGLWAWGWNICGQLGDGTWLDKALPTRIRADMSFKSIEAGFYHSLAIDEDNRLWAWGDNEFGALADGTTANKNAPIRVKGDTLFTSVSAGYDYSLAISAANVLWAWGLNSSGQLGDDSTVNKHKPVSAMSVCSCDDCYLCQNDIHDFANGTCHATCSRNCGAFQRNGGNHTPGAATCTNPQRCTVLACNFEINPASCQNLPHKCDDCDRSDTCGAHVCTTCGIVCNLHNCTTLPCNRPCTLHNCTTLPCNKSCSTHSCNAEADCPGLCTAHNCTTLPCNRPCTLHNCTTDPCDRPCESHNCEECGKTCDCVACLTIIAKKLFEEIKLMLDEDFEDVKGDFIEALSELIELNTLIETDLNGSLPNFILKLLEINPEYEEAYFDALSEALCKDDCESGHCLFCANKDIAFIMVSNIIINANLELDGFPYPCDGDGNFYICLLCFEMADSDGCRDEDCQGTNVWPFPFECLGCESCQPPCPCDNTCDGLCGNCLDCGECRCPIECPCGAEGCIILRIEEGSIDGVTAKSDIAPGTTATTKCGEPIVIDNPGNLVVTVIEIELDGYDSETGTVVEFFNALKKFFTT